MNNRYVVDVPSYYSVGLARLTALRECVMHSRLFREFSEGRQDDEDLDQFSKRMDDFILDRNVRIIDEKIVGRIDGNRYITDVEFVVTWD